MRLSLLLIISSALIAQNPPGELSIAGVVVNSQSGEPIKNALVTLTTSTARHVGGSKSMLSGLAGDFLFTGLAEGHYELQSEKPGFVSEDRRPVLGSKPWIELKSSITDVRVMLSPLGVIEGQVLDQYGDPAGGVNVVALSLRIVDGIRTTSSERSVSTNDQGKYRLWNLTPGKYYIKAAGKGGGTYAYIGDSATLADTWEGFTPVYSGGASELNSAIPVLVGVGEQAQADVRIVRQRAFKIRGTLGNFVPHKPAIFELVRGEEIVSTSRSTVNGTTGRFEILDVTPGSYLLRVTQDRKTRAEMNIAVRERDLNNVALTLSPALNLKVTLRLTESHPGPVKTNGVFGLSGILLGSCDITLRGSYRDASKSAGVHFKDRESVIADVLPGTYRVSLRCNGGYPAAVVFGRVDLLSTPQLTILPGAIPEPIEIALNPNPTVLLVHLAMDPMPEKIAVLLVPASGVSCGPVLESVNYNGDLNSGAILQFDSLAPGDYTAFAFSKADEVEFRNPEFLQALRGGLAVHLVEKENKEVTIKSLVR